eukprot:GHVH01010055.1.p1 GENE.GHVH01010055.1~~GHVH01010055.1.p1  ORF type:complete len:147 (+),score=11.00 GHVH01010055.1:488-928(+)
MVYKDAIGDENCPEEKLAESRAVCLKAFSALSPLNEIISTAVKVRLTNEETDNTNNTYLRRVTYDEKQIGWEILEKRYNSRQILNRCRESKADFNSIYSSNFAYFTAVNQKDCSADVRAELQIAGVSALNAWETLIKTGSAHGRKE